MRPHRLLFSILFGTIGTIVAGLALPPYRPGNFQLPLWAADPIIGANLPAFVAGVAFGRFAYLLVAFVQWFFVAYAIRLLLSK
jgi:hypothetical protein